MKNFMRCAFVSVSLALSLFVLGCAGGTAEDQPDLGKVTGTVTMNNQPLSNVEVTFVPAEGRPSVGTTDADGKYELSYIRDIKGAKIGTHVVRITTIHESTSDREGGVPPKETIPRIYNVESTLKRDVTAGENVIDFPLTSQ